MLIQRQRNKTVTTFPVLIPCSSREQQGVATFIGESGEGFQSVRELTDADVDTDSKRSEVREVWKSENDFFVALSGLLTAVNDRLATTRARERLIKAIAAKQGIESDSELSQLVCSSLGVSPEKGRKMALELSTLGPRQSADERWLLSTQLSEALNSVRLVLWWSGTQFRPALYCPDMKSALYTYFLMKTMTGGRAWGVCPYCGKSFVQTRSDQTYCSIAHREAHRVARWRAKKQKQILKSKKKGKRNGTHKTR